MRFDFTLLIGLLDYNFLFSFYHVFPFILFPPFFFLLIHLFAYNFRNIEEIEAISVKLPLSYLIRCLYKFGRINGFLKNNITSFVLSNNILDFITWIIIWIIKALYQLLYDFISWFIISLMSDSLVHSNVFLLLLGSSPFQRLVTEYRTIFGGLDH